MHNYSYPEIIPSYLVLVDHQRSSCRCLYAGQSGAEWAYHKPVWGNHQTTGVCNPLYRPWPLLQVCNAILLYFYFLCSSA